MTALMFAASNGHGSIIPLLIEKGSQVDEKDIVSYIAIYMNDSYLIDSYNT